MKFFVKRVLSFVLLFCLILPLFACGLIEQSDSKKEPWSNAANPPSTTEKEKAPEELIVGTWVLSSEEAVIYGETYNFDEDDYDTVSTMAFYGDGSTYSCSGGTASDGNWHMEGNKLIIISDDFKGTYTVVRLSQTSLILRINSSDLTEMVGLTNPDDMSFYPEDYYEYTFRRQGS